MKNRRGINLGQELVAKHDLSLDRPPKDSFFWTSWVACTSIAEKALATDFIQGINNANLDPVIYGGFQVCDAYYCYSGESDYLTSANRAEDPKLKAFLQAKHLSYKKYNATFSTIWHVKNADSIIPNEACKTYSEFERSVATNELPIYTLIAMLPCEYLWTWLAEQMTPPSEGNLYRSWITDNNDPVGAYAMGNYIELYKANHSFDSNKALEIYTTAMNHEMKNFSAATEKSDAYS